MYLNDFYYELPLAQIAQQPLADRGASRMLVFGRETRRCEDRRFSDLPEILRGDELVIVNNARVIPARLFGWRLGVHAEKQREESAAGHKFPKARIEVLLLRQIEPNLWEALVRPGRKIGIGERIVFGDSRLEAEVVRRGAFGLRELHISGTDNVFAEIDRIGHMPLPPYIRRSDKPLDRERYQTIFASRPGAVAAPTAGLHFTPAILDRLRNRGIEVRQLTLHVGLGTFQPIHSENLEEHQIHSEEYEIPAETADAIRAARRERRPILAIGTTVVRALEDSARKAETRGAQAGEVLVGTGVADLFVLPGHRFSVVNQLLTNFHLPRSTLLVLVAAFAGREGILAAYQRAVSDGYRFYSYGDCMLIR
jgi:S-adenosylmethionine:tRNA ribosyltransferase-isomerase